MSEKELKIRDFCGDYALDIPDYNGSNFTLYFNSKRNAENVKRIIEIDGSKPNEATVCDMQEIKHGEWLPTNHSEQKRCSVCDVISFIASYPCIYRADYCPYCRAKMDKE